MDEPKVPLKETLLPALVQCFGIILIGFILGKTKILNETQSRGLSIFVQYLSLPALIFVTVSTISFTKVRWEFIAAVFVSKTCIFICVSLISILLTRNHDLGKAGIFSLLATQSNDFALGYPLLVALYQDTHPEFPIYLYIIAPIQLLGLNTIGFFFLEIEKQTLGILKGNLSHIIKGTLKNPVVIMTVIGLIWNVTYGQEILPIFDNILKAFSSAFPATALLLLGHTMTISSEKTSTQATLSVTLIIITKCLLFPLILQKCSGFFLRSHPPDVVQSFSTFGFLYGILPSAPTVHVFATQYSTCIDIATKTIIGSTIFSAPLMFATSSVVSLTQIGVKDLSSYLSLTISYLSSINMLCSALLLLILLNGRRWKSISFGVTFYLAFAQLLTALGGILLFFAPSINTPLFYAHCILSTGSMYATRFSSLMLAILLLIIRIRSLCYILQIRKIINFLSIFVCFLLPYIIAATLIYHVNQEYYEPNFQLGSTQIITTFSITLISFVGTISCIILQQVYLKKHKRETEKSSYISYQNCNLEEDETTDGICNPDIEDLCIHIPNIPNEHIIDHNLIDVDITDRICDPLFQCNAVKRVQCTEQLSRYIDENNEIGTGLIDDEYFCKHIILLVIFSCAMMLSLFVCFWKFVMESANGIFIELEFLDVILNFSLGIVCFIMFGLDSKLLNLMLVKFKICFNISQSAIEN